MITIGSDVLGLVGFWFLVWAIIIMAMYLANRLFEKDVKYGGKTDVGDGLHKRGVSEVGDRPGECDKDCD